MSTEEALLHDFVAELDAERGVSDARYAEAVAALGEHGVLDLLGLVGYFTTISMVLNVARTPAGAPAGVVPLPPRATGGADLQASIAP
jgi:4-carboxymuconolactone decarboxylase